MRTLGASKRHIFQKLVVPASLTDIFAGLKLTVGFALIGAIVGEFMSSSEGLGHAIFKAGSLYIIPKVFAALVATIALALVPGLGRRQDRAAADPMAATLQSRAAVCPKEENECNHRKGRPIRWQVSQGDLKYALSATDPFVAEVQPGEMFEVETEINIGGHSFTRSTRS